MLHEEVAVMHDAVGNTSGYGIRDARWRVGVGLGVEQEGACCLCLGGWWGGGGDGGGDDGGGKREGRGSVWGGRMGGGVGVEEGVLDLGAP